MPVRKSTGKRRSQRKFKKSGTAPPSLIEAVIAPWAQSYESAIQQLRDVELSAKARTAAAAAGLQAQASPGRAAGGAQRGRASSALVVQGTGQHGLRQQENDRWAISYVTPVCELPSCCTATHPQSPCSLRAPGSLLK